MNTARRLDYVLVNDSLFVKLTSSEIHWIPMTDLRAVVIESHLNNFPRGPSFYKFNVSLLKDNLFVNEM